MSKKETSNYLISVLPKESSDDDYHDAVNWSHSNLSHENILSISLDDVYSMQDIWDIINEINNSMLGPYEDCRVSLQSDRIAILDKLKLYKKEINNKKKSELLSKIIELFELAVQINHSIYFLF